MPSGQQPMTASSRDGTSQSGRILRELDPDYAQVDERTTQDLLAFAKAYAPELKYFGLEDPDHAQGDWSGFIGGAVDLDAAADYSSAPEKFPPDRAAPYARPHFALFLAFLELLGHARVQFNALTRRHLEFFYRDVLRMVRKRAVPDKVHVLVDLESGTDRLALPAGTALRAGKDSLGRELVYRTDRQLIANQVQIGQISSLHAEMKITGIEEASRQYLVSGTRNEAFVAMLRIALGQPNPGDPLPVDLNLKPPLYPGVPPADQPNPQVGFDELVQAQKLIGVVESELGMPLFDDFRDLMRWKRQRQDKDASDWKEINSFLVTAGKKRDENFTINPQDSSDFKTNVQAALNKTLDDLFDGLPEVETMEDAYSAYVDRPKEVEAFLKQALAPLSLDDFKAMMRIKVLMDNEWDEINRLLEEAGKRKDANFKLKPEVRAAHDFNAKLAAVAAVAPMFEFAGGIDAYFAAFLAVEQYFYMPVERFKYIMLVATNDKATDVWDWDKVYEIVAASHTKMIYARRRDTLKAAAQPGIKANNNLKALGDMLAVVLGEKLSGDGAQQVDEALQNVRLVRGGGRRQGIPEANREGRNGAQLDPRGRGARNRPAQPGKGAGGREGRMAQSLSGGGCQKGAGAVGAAERRDAAALGNLRAGRAGERTDPAGKLRLGDGLAAAGAGRGRERGQIDA